MEAGSNIYLQASIENFLAAGGTQAEIEHCYAQWLTDSNLIGFSTSEIERLFADFLRTWAMAKRYLPKPETDQLTPSPDVELSNGTIMRFRREPNGSQFVYPLQRGEQGEFTADEWKEWLKIVRAEMAAKGEQLL